ncbi:DsbA family protein [Patescibacteria group bacterium]|nr:DsbA family protein [Patescibacteria group bacterium]MBU1612966.1 DsbA family protein [Patescibacteria group bacterium]
MNTPEAKWYQTWWGVTSAGLVALAIVGALGFAILVGKYWWMIKQGRGDELLTQIQKTQPVAKDDPLLMAKRKELETADDPFLGNPNAEIVIVEFVDYKCSNCKSAAPILHQIIDKFGYKVKIIVRDFPIETAHPGATKLAEIAFCANEQGVFWKMHDILFQVQDELPAELSVPDINRLADLAGVNKTKLQSCLDKQEPLIEVNLDYAVGYKNQMRGTPTYFVNGQKVQGVIPREDWEKYLNSI